MLQIYQQHRGISPTGGNTILGGSWDLVSKVISPLIGVISIVTLVITLLTKSHDPLSRFLFPKTLNPKP